MEETTAMVEAPAPELEAAPGHGADAAVPAVHAHPSPLKYVGVAVILATVTFMEVGLYYTSLTGPALVAPLLGLAFIKFGMVAAYFMHLKFDGRLLRRLFVTGIALAAAVYGIALFTLGVLFH